ncbi:MAG TPA: phage holin family protein [Candidatus Limnocylindrales bacterium]|jgi:putative membrane protein|nr:phage holin family protein [Candidatus Limnocylindrales bacterium]
MKGIVLRILAGAIAFVILLQLLPATFLDFKGDTVQLVILALGVGVVNAIIKPVVSALSMPISLLTLGIFGFVVNAALMLGIAWAAQSFASIDFSVGGFPPDITSDTLVGAVVASVLLSVVSTAVGLVVRD